MLVFSHEVDMLLKERKLAFVLCQETLQPVSVGEGELAVLNESGVLDPVNWPMEPIPACEQRHTIFEITPRILIALDFALVYAPEQK